MAFNKKEWTDRQVEYPNRRTITDIDSGETSSVMITRDEGQVTVPGDLLDAYNLNDLEDRISSAIDSKSTVTFTPSLIYGTKIGEISIDGESTNIIAPAGGGGGGSSVAVQQTLTSGTEIGKIIVDSIPTTLYAPTPTPQTTVIVTQTLTSGTEVGKIKVNNVSTTLYAPAGGGGGGGTDYVKEAIYEVSEILSYDPYPEGAPAPYQYYIMEEDNGDGTFTATLDAMHGVGRFLFVTANDALGSWRIYRSGYEQGSEVVVLEDTGLCEDRIVYLPESHYFGATYREGYRPILKMPAGQMLL